jgi:hypothetical protein
MQCSFVDVPAISAYSPVQGKGNRKGATCKVDGVQLRTVFEPESSIKLGGNHEGVGTLDGSAI